MHAVEIQQEGDTQKLNNPKYAAVVVLWKIQWCIFDAYPHFLFESCIK